LPLLAREADGTLVRWHHVNPETGMYRDRQVLDVKL
jgi:ribosomal protein L32